MRGVGCIEKEAPGGTYLNVGCIPGKALLDSSKLFYQARITFGRHGIRAGQLELDLASMTARKDQVVQTLTRGIAGLFRKHRVESFRGTASIDSPTAVKVQQDQ